MLYLEHKPAQPLRRFVRSLWYAQVPYFDHQRQRILPSGCAQLIVSLSRDFLLNCPEGQPDQRTAPALVVGQRSTFEIVDTADMADLIGAAFLPGFLPAFTAERADLFSNCTVPLDHICNADTLRLHLLELSSPQQRLDCLETFLRSRLEAGPFELHPAVEFALHHFARPSETASVAEIARTSGWSERTLSRVFREQVGFTPRAWHRIQRFQRAVRQLHAGVEMRWAELAQECGFYDQAHFANEFRAFSGIDATTYSATRNRVWANHARLD